MIKLKTGEEIEILRENALLVSKTLAEVGKHIVPGVTTLELNKILSAIMALSRHSLVMEDFLIPCASL